MYNNIIEDNTKFNIKIKEVVEKDKLNFLIIEIYGTINLVNSNSFLKEILNILEYKFKYYVLDFTNLDFIDSVGLSTLITISQKLNECGSKLIILNPKSSIMIVLKITKINQKISVFSYLDEVREFIIKDYEKAVIKN